MESGIQPSDNCEFCNLAREGQKKSPPELVIGRAETWGVCPKGHYWIQTFFHDEELWRPMNDKEFKGFQSALNRGSANIYWNDLND